MKKCNMTTREQRKKMGFVLLLTLLCAVALGGCQLAMDEKETRADRFVGLSVRLTGSSDFDRSEPHEVDGQTLIFPIEVNEQGDIVVMGDTGTWFSNVDLSFRSTESSEERDIEATLYVCDLLIPAGTILKAEEVYQRPDGSLYAINGGHNYSGHLSGLKLEVSQSHTAAASESNESNSANGGLGGVVEETCRVTLHIESDIHVLSAELIEMDADNREIARHALSDATQIELSAQAEWALIEETLADGDLRRTALNAPFDEQSIEIRRPNELGVCVPVSYTLCDAQP